MADDLPKEELSALDRRIRRTLASLPRPAPSRAVQIRLQGLIRADTEHHKTTPTPVYFHIEKTIDYQESRLMEGGFQLSLTVQYSEKEYNQ